jgi:hypothetical protein
MTRVKKCSVKTYKIYVKLFLLDIKNSYNLDVTNLCWNDTKQSPVH